MLLGRCRSFPILGVLFSECQQVDAMMLTNIWIHFLIDFGVSSCWVFYIIWFYRGNTALSLDLYDSLFFSDKVTCSQCWLHVNVGGGRWRLEEDFGLEITVGGHWCWRKSWFKWMSTKIRNLNINRLSPWVWICYLQTIKFKIQILTDWHWVWAVEVWWLDKM